MPVTINPCNVALEEYYYSSSRAITSDAILKVPLQTGSNLRCKEIFQSSFSQDMLDSRAVHPSKSSFVYAAMNAYNNHHHLVIRPDDIWITILTQFSIYVNRHAEELRSMFVSHEGQKQLTINSVGTRYSVDFGSFAVQFSDLLDQNVIDPELRNWIMPNFTTTEDNDKIVSSVIMMATLQKYFAYGIHLMCGLPAVTLLGEKSDWEMLLQKLEKLQTFGPETAQFAGLLRPILTRFVACFDNPESEDIKNFWQTVVNRQGGGSGPRYLGGWITAFCFWSGKGDVQYRTDVSIWGNKARTLTLDGQLYGLVDTNDVVGGYASVPVELNDNGVKFNTTMIAGMVAIESRPKVERDEEWEEGNRKLKAEAKDYQGPARSVIQPMAGWWIFHSEEVKDRYRDEL
ncbi:hypothetical protein H072_8118 [Dactylellina haptotyla CBS 200.50]|uniref:DUF4419 domain-containing protein n=1 Tax=Dactylellina haptotyla (strain CBS 200.50) TaxID=1284197 RepID=S8AAJ6_DACHA|nr:hypothetical protein H072_8118 [Dactylellina haptotyla CBS 200.50]